MNINFKPETVAMVLLGFNPNDWIFVPESRFNDRGLNHPILFGIQVELPEGAWIAGGCFERTIHSEKITDIDIFCRDQHAFEEAIEYLTRGADMDDEDPFSESGEGSSEQEGRGWKLETPEEILDLETTRYAKLTKPGRPDIQIIKTMWYPSLEAVLHSFDFTAAQIGTRSTSNGVEIVMNPMSLSDIHRKRLVLWRMTFPSSTIRRMIKYAQKGYYACGGALEQIAKGIQEQMTSHPEVSDVQYID